jgi:aminoglycoside 6'-N-acetyltransferase
MLQGTLVCIRPVQHDDLALLAAWANDREAIGAYNDFGLEGASGLEAGFGQRGLIDDRNATLVIALPDGTVVGSIGYHQVAYGPNSGSMAYNIGLHVIPEQRGRGYGSEAQRLLADYLLSTYPIGRVEAATDITNLPEQRALEKAGFTREGVLRKAQWRAGRWHDLVVYSRVRGDAPHLDIT